MSCVPCGNAAPGRSTSLMCPPARSHVLGPFVRWGSLVTVALFALFFGGCGGTLPVRQLSLESLVQAAERKAYLVDQFRASFEKTRHSDLFNRSLSVAGTLVFQKPNRLRLTMHGDVNVEILSDGGRITLIHDQTDQETFHVQGDRDLARFADPLMLLIQNVGRGGLREFSVVETRGDEGSLNLEAEPRAQVHFERIKRVRLNLSETGEMRRVTILFRDGNQDETVFHSWRALADDDPEILALNERLSVVSKDSTFVRKTEREARWQATSPKSTLRTVGESPGKIL